jgi:hypothetical protein
LIKAIDSSLRLAVGENTGPTLLPAPEGAILEGIRDSVRAFVVSMRQEDNCPVCLEAARAWREWIAWLESAAGMGEIIEDLLPTCREHAWGCAELGGLQLGIAIAKNASRLVLNQLRNANKNYAPRERGKAESRLDYTWRMLLDARKTNRKRSGDRELRAEIPFVQTACRSARYGAPSALRAYGGATPAGGF